MLGLNTGVATWIQLAIIHPLIFLWAYYCRE